MGKLGDLFVRLGLKKDDFSRGMKGAAKDSEAFAKTMQAVGKAVKMAWAGISAAIVKFASDALKMTNKWGDAWAETVAAAQAAYGVFVRQLSSGEGWTDLFSNMREAARLAREATAALDELGERKISFGYQSAETEREIARLQLIMRDSSKGNKERQDAARQIIALEKQLGDQKKELAQQEAEAMRKQFQAQTRMNDAEIDFLVRRYNENRNAILQSRDYLAAQQRLNKELEAAKSSYGTGAMTGKAYEAIEARRKAAQEALADLESTTPQYIKDIAALTKKYDQGNDELVAGMAKAEVAVINVDTEVMKAQARAVSLLGTLKKAADELGEAGEAQSRPIKIESVLAQPDAPKLELPNRVEFEPIKIIPPEMEWLDSFNDDLEAGLDRALDTIAALKEAVTTGFSESMQVLMDQFAGLEEVNPGRIVQALLTPLADMAIKEGEILMAEGIGVEACKEALESLNGYAALAAGAALIAIGAAAKSGLAALASTGGKTTSASTYAGASSSAGTQQIQTEMTIYVKGTIKGSDIVLSGQKTINSWNR